jgi:lipoprotein NlpI
MMRHLTCTIVIACAVAAHAQRTPAPAQSPETLLNRAVTEFENRRFAEAVSLFDDLIRAVPEYRPQLWQRGIALYYAGRYRDCRAQFELHRTVNPDDVENAAWHFLCVAREESIEKARALLLPVGPDSRVPMRQVYQMLRGAMTPDGVLAAAGSDPAARFYAQLYVGLYAEASGRKDAALEHIGAAAAGRYATVGGYMHMVARVHLAARQRQP